MSFSFFLCIAFISFFSKGQEDQSTLHHLSDRAIKSENLLGKFGANLSHFFIFRGFGIAGFIIAYQLFLSGLFILFKRKLSKIIVSWNYGLSAMILCSVTFGFLPERYAVLSGVIGFEINDYFKTLKSVYLQALFFLL